MPMTATATITRTHYIRCTCVLDGRCHLVTNDAMATALTTAQRRFPARRARARPRRAGRLGRPALLGLRHRGQTEPAPTPGRPTVSGLAVRPVPSTSAGYGDGPVYVQINKKRAGDAWPRPGYEVKVGDPWSFDTEHDYVPAHNSWSAFVYTRWMLQDGVPQAALSVVRLAENRNRP